MNWGLELWDQFDNVDKNCQHGVEFLEKYSKFVKERSSIEIEYASKLRKLVKNYQPKKRHEDRNIFSVNKAFQSQLSELNDIAGQHEIVAENLMSNVINTANQTVSEIKQEKKKLFHEGKKLQSDLENLERQVESSKKKFEKEWRDYERLIAYHAKLDADVNVTKADVEKAKHNAQSKRDVVEHCKTDYGSNLFKFNESQKLHYMQEMPKIFESYYNSDQLRINKLQSLMTNYADIDAKVKPIIQKCLDGMKQASEAINPTLDAGFVVERLKSGFPIPGDKEFEDYTSPNKPADESQHDSPRISVNSKNKKTGLSWLFGQKKIPESPDFSHLPPEQRKKRLQAKINDLRKEINKQEEGRNGILRMQEVYRSNPALGDATSVQPQINLATTQIDKLKAELQQHETWYAEATGKPAPVPSPQPSRPLSASMKTLSTSSTPSIPPPPKIDSNIPPAPPLASGLAPPAVEEIDDSEDQSFGDEFEDGIEAIGSCEALYDYEASSEGEMSMRIGEVFQILEADSGDGWTRVASEDSGDGYVPTSYIEIKFLN